jgi:hypothetical protein
MKDGIYTGAQVEQLFEDHDYSKNEMLQREEPGRHFATAAETS